PTRPPTPRTGAPTWSIRDGGAPASRRRLARRAVGLRAGRARAAVLRRRGAQGDPRPARTRAADAAGNEPAPGRARGAGRGASVARRAGRPDGARAARAAIAAGVAAAGSRAAARTTRGAVARTGHRPAPAR